MTDTDPPWEPPLAGNEAEHLFGALDRLRATFRWKADGLDADGLNTTVGASSLTLGGLLKHLAVVEETTFSWKVRGAEPGPPWDSAARASGHDWDLTSAAELTPAELYALWDEGVELSRTRFGAALADGGLDQPVSIGPGDGRHANLRRVVCDLVEEYGRHTGHADLLREAIDGRVGEDPPDDWRPSAGPPATA